jgi:hypothetical protein
MEIALVFITALCSFTCQDQPHFERSSRSACTIRKLHHIYSSISILFCGSTAIVSALCQLCFSSSFAYRFTREARYPARRHSLLSGCANEKVPLRSESPRPALLDLILFTAIYFALSGQLMLERRALTVPDIETVRVQVAEKSRVKTHRTSLLSIF